MPERRLTCRTVLGHEWEFDVLATATATLEGHRVKTLTPAVDVDVDSQPGVALPDGEWPAVIGDDGLVYIFADPAISLADADALDTDALDTDADSGQTVAALDEDEKETTDGNSRNPGS